MTLYRAVHESSRRPFAPPQPSEFAMYDLLRTAARGATQEQRGVVLRVEQQDDVGRWCHYETLALGDLAPNR